jgi:hypothetical protein
MASEAWEKRLANLVKKYKETSDVAAFRNDFGNVVQQAQNDRKINTATASLLLEARGILEIWASSTPPSPESAYEQWKRLHDPAVLPADILESLLRRHPSPKTAAPQCWEQFVVSSSDGRFIDALLDRRVLTEADLNRIAQEKPSDFYQSPALDVLVARRALIDILPIWTELARGTPRPKGLMTRESLLVHCYALSKGGIWNGMMVLALAQPTTARDDVFDSLIRERQAAIRLCEYLTSVGSTGEMHSGEGLDKEVGVLLLDWVRRCEANLDPKLKSVAETASMILGVIRLALLTEVADSALTWKTKTSEEASQITEKGVVRVLESLETGTQAAGQDTTFVLRGTEIKRAVQGFLRRLPASTDAADGSPERTMRVERYLGSKQVIDQLLIAMEEASDEGGLRDAIEVALFNCGVRPLAKVGEQVRFNPREHESEAPGVLPAEAVVVTTPGRRLGSLEDGFVLVKARTRSVTNSERK